jgi:hypothetical protein
VTVRRVLNQSAQHVESGAILRSFGRDAMQFELDGRLFTITVERGNGADLFYLPSVPSWDDGELMVSDVAALLRPVITEIEAFWGAAAEFRTTD